MNTPSQAIAAVSLSLLFLFVGCGGEPENVPPQAGGDDGKTAPIVLAEPSEIPQGLKKLNLTKSQAEKINDWLADQTGIPDPSDYAQFVGSVLRDDQMAAFRILIESGGGGE